MAAPLIHVAELGKEYRSGEQVVHALCGVTVTIEAGEFVAVMGPSGSGKTTFLNLLGCLDGPTEGRYLLEGTDVSELSEDALAEIRSRKIGFVFQTFNLLARTSARENVELPLLYANVPLAERKRRAQAILESLGLGDRRGHQPGQLSGGEQQRVAIARALVNQPAVILADEPTGALESRTSKEIMAAFEALGRAGMTIVLVTHDPDIARHAGRILTFRDGRVIDDSRNGTSAHGAGTPGSHGQDTARNDRRSAGIGFAASLRTALRALWPNRLRSGLTMLGIVIGVAAVITMIAIGDGARSRVAEQISSLGANLLLVQPGSLTAQGARLGAGSKPTLTEDDAEAIASEVTAVTVAAPTVYRRVQLVRGNLNWSATLHGITPDYLVAREWEVVAGRPVSDEDVQSAAKVALLGETVADKLFGGAAPVGEIVRARNTPLTVIGVLAHKGQNTSGGDQDDIVMVPLSTAKMRIVGRTQGKLRSVQYVLVKVYAEEAMAEAESQIRALLRQRHRLQPDDDDDFRVRNLADIMETKAQTSRAFTLLLAAVASVSLVVGGISIMNIMLVSVTERTREIGLRVAMGARRRDVRNQFLIEALTLSMMGGTVGIVLGIGAAVAIAGGAGWPILLRAEAIVLAFGFAAAVGVFFGFYPARKASRADPIEALRYE